MKINHKFVSNKTDGPDSTLVKPSDWDALHNVVTDADGVVLGRLSGTGPGPVVEIPLSLPFGSLTVYDEKILAAPAVEIIVNVPVPVRYVELQFLTLNISNLNDTLKLNGMNGAAIQNLAPHQTQYLVGSGNAAFGSFVNADNGWRLGDAIAASQGVAHPNWWPAQIIGTANLWAITAAGTRFSYQIAYDGGSTVQPTGYRLANAGATQFATGSYLRSVVIV